MINQLRAQALDAWGEIHPDLAQPYTLDYLLQSRDHIVIFWFDKGNGSRHPVLISKLPRHMLFNYYLDRSIQRVDQLKAGLKSPVIETIPVRIHAGQVHQLFHMVMSAMPGDPLKIPGNSVWGRRIALKARSMPTGTGCSIFSRNPWLTTKNQIGRLTWPSITDSLRSYSWIALNSTR